MGREHSESAPPSETAAHRQVRPLSMRPSKALREHLRSYQYMPPNLSILERIFLNQFWTQCAELCPRWLAPNLITSLGFLSALSGTVCLLLNSPDLRGDCPPWALRFLAVCLFVYQTMDGIDGKQARRTRSGSPLGELFDHAVDGIVICFYWCVTAELLCISTSSAEFAVFGVLSQTAFFSSNLVLLHCGKQSYQEMDAQELQFITYGAAVVVSFFGSATAVMKSQLPVPELIASIWAYLPTLLVGQQGVDFQLKPGSIGFNRLLYVGGTCGMLSSISLALVAVAKHYSEPSDPRAPVKEGRGGEQFFVQLGSMMLLSLFSVLSWTGLDAEGAGSAIRLLYWATITVSFADLVAHTLCTRTAQVPFPLPFESNGIACLIVFSLLAYLRMHPLLRAIPSNSSGDWAITALRVGTFVVNFGFFLHYVVSMGTAMCEALEINFFRIPYSEKL